MGALDRDDIELRGPAACPFDKQPCLKEACAAWIVYTRADGTRYVGCSFVFLPVLIGEQIVETQRMQASVDKVASEVQRAALLPLKAALLSRVAPRLGSG